MATRLTAEARREHILDAAARAFADRGYEATRMDDVAGEAGVAKGLLYKHFPSKDALFEALLDRQGEWFAQTLRQTLAGASDGADPETLLRRGLSVWVEQVASKRPEFNFADSGLHDAYDTLRERVRSEIVDVFLAFAPDAAEQIAGARLVAAALQGAAESMVIAWRDDPGDLTADDVVELLAMFCWDGLEGLRRTLQALGTLTPAR